MNIKIATLICAGTISLLIACGDKKEKDNTENTSEQQADSVKATQSIESKNTDNTLSAAEKEEGWMLLFDGKSTENWRGYQKDNFPLAWEIDDNSLHIQGSGRGEAGAKDGGDIVYKKQFADFHLKVDWKVDSAANSGILYRGKETFDYIWKTAPEMQVLDNAHHPDAKLGKNGNRQAGSLYDLIPAEPQNFKGHEKWNTAEVVAKGNNIMHIQNGDTVVHYTIGSDRMANLIANSKWADINENWGDIADSGYIALQDHGDDVWFKNIKIKEL